MKIVSWNINSIRARVGYLKLLITQHSPDIILLQETKCMDEQFPSHELEDYGYNIRFRGQKSYNGVAILSKHRIEDVSFDMNGFAADEARYIECLVDAGKKPIRAISVYVPNGTDVSSPRFEFKLEFYRQLKEHFAKISKYQDIVAAGGDYNVAPENIDVYDPAHLEGKLAFHWKERKEMRSILSSMYDSYRLQHPDAQEFSWWDYRGSGWKQNKGMRIDQILLSSEGADCLVEAGIKKSFRDLERPSDHVPVYCILDVK